MCKKFISFVCLVLTFTLASTSYGLVVGNWEDSSMDGWTTSAGEGMDGGATTAFSGTGVTLDSSSLAVTTSNGWKKTICGVLDSAGLVALQITDARFTMDVTLIGSDWDEGSGAKIDSVIFQTSFNSWQQVGGVMSDWDGVTDTTFHLDVAVPADLIAAAPITWGKITLATWINTAGEGYEGVIGNFYLDNAVLIPEPTTIALLGLGGLALLRRKR